jgi:hypothetical protein
MRPNPLLRARPTVTSSPSPHLCHLLSLSRTVACLLRRGLHLLSTSITRRSRLSICPSASSLLRLRFAVRARMDATGGAKSDPVAAEVEETQAQSLSQLFQGCLDLYSRLCLALGGVDCPAVQLREVDLEKAQSEYGRLRLWGSQSRATLPAHARGSLDDTLRHDQTLKENVAAMFRLLMRQLELGRYPGQEKPAPRRALGV